MRGGCDRVFEDFLVFSQPGLSRVMKSNGQRKSGRLISRNFIGPGIFLKMWLYLKNFFLNGDFVFGVIEIIQEELGFNLPKTRSYRCVICT